jgi:hypothetical protein
MSTVGQFNSLVSARGSDVVFHRDDSSTPCPCRTPEGFRDPQWHLDHPLEPVCNEEGMLPGGAGVISIVVKAFVQPIQSTRATRLQTEFLQQMFGTVEADDHLGIFPITWAGQSLDFFNWSESGEDWIEYFGRRFTVVNANLIPDPEDGNPQHHWEVGLRLVSNG